MRTAVHTPGPALHLRIENNPVRRIGPLVRNSHRGASPGSPSVLATEHPDIRICNEDAPCVEWIKMHAVSCRHIQADCGPTRIVDLARIDSAPGSAAIGGAHCAAEVSAVCKVRVLVRHCHIQGILSPRDAKTVRNPVIMNVVRRTGGFLPHQLPILA